MQLLYSTTYIEDRYSYYEQQVASDHKSILGLHKVFLK